MKINDYTVHLSICKKKKLSIVSTLMDYGLDYIK